MTYEAISKHLDYVTKGNEDAKQFLLAWYAYLHLIDDIVDGDQTPEKVVKVARWANDIYSFTYYRNNEIVLRPQIQLITLVYEESNEFAKSDVKWKRDAADVLRHCGADMVRLVAWMIGGYDHAKQISKELREFCYADHHTSDGKPI